MNQQSSFYAMFAPEAESPLNELTGNFWKVMLVDDEPDIHAVLRLALQDIEVEGRPLQLFDAASAEETKALLSQHPDIALILLDVVMETERAGLELVQYIRNELANKSIKIVLFTGQPGYAPHRKVVTDYEIDGYRLKSELTADKIFVSVYSALRAYQSMCNSDCLLKQVEAQGIALRAQNEVMQMNEELLREQNKELLATEERLRVQIEEYKVSQAQRMLVEDALRKSEIKHRSILQTAMDGFWLVSTEGCLLEVSETYCRMSGYSAQELLGMSIADLEYVGDGEEAISRIQNIIKSGEDRFESRHRRKDGSLFDVEVSVQFRPDSGGELVTFLRDITERKQIEKAQLFLVKECRGGAMDDEPFFNRMARYLAHNLNIDYVRIDRLAGDTLTAQTLAIWHDGRIKENETYSLKDTPSGEVIGTDICCFPTDVCRLFPHDKALQNLKAESYIGVTLWNSSNQPIGLIALIGCQPQANQSLTEVILKLVAIRAASELERLEAEEEKAKLESQLHQAQKMESVGRLAGGVAHDFNNMLAVILGHAELALMHLDPSHRVCGDLKEISKSAERSADLTRQLLAFARKQTVSPKVIDLNDTVTNMLKMLQRLIGEDIQLVWQPSPNQCLVNMDPSQIDQILANLCVNARDAITDTGRITIETGNCSIDADYCAANPEAMPGDYVCLVVRDNGRGMDEEMLAHIFEPFYTTKQLGKGTGLGLATVYGAVKQNNGFITIYSEPGKGTTFSIHLPHFAEDTVKKHAEGDSPAVPVPRGQEVVLLVEDETAILNITAIMLENQGYTVLRADSPGRALELARLHHGAIHLLLTDVIMPEMNGRDLARNILTIHPGVKRLFMSGYTSDVIAHHGVLDDGVHFIQKPFSLPNVAQKVREVLDSH